MDIIAIANAGAFTVLVATWFGIGVGLIRKWWVPGWMYVDEVKWRDRMTAAMEKLAAQRSRPPKGEGGA